MKSVRRLPTPNRSISATTLPPMLPPSSRRRHVFNLTFENLTRGFLRSPGSLRSLHTKALDPECLDRHVRRPRCDELGHDGAGSGAKLEAVRREAELVERPVRCGALSEHRDIVRHSSLDAGPGPQNRDRAHGREHVPDGLGALGEVDPVEHRDVLIAHWAAEMAASYQHRPVRELLERQLAPAKDHPG